MDYVIIRVKPPYTLFQPEKIEYTLYTLEYHLALLNKYSTYLFITKILYYTLFYWMFINMYTLYYWSYGVKYLNILYPLKKFAAAQGKRAKF